MTLSRIYRILLRYAIKGGSVLCRSAEWRSPSSLPVVRELRRKSERVLPPTPIGSSLVGEGSTKAIAQLCDESERGDWI
jgi:hypothetical protein